MAALAPPSGSCPYATLGLHAGASADDIRAAFRRAALRTHPDKPGGSPEAFSAVHHAYEALLGSGGAEFLAAGDAPPAAATGASFDGWSSGGGFDPWSTESAAAFNPWGGTAFDPWGTSIFGEGAGVGDAWANLDAGASAPSAAELAEEEARRKRKRANKLAKADAKRRRAGKGGGSNELDPSKKMTRYGVYGFRPSSDESSSEEPAEGAPGVAAPPQQVHYPAAAAPRPTRPAAAPRRPERQFQCSIHQKLRFESHLIDDGARDARPGMECP